MSDDDERALGARGLSMDGRGRDATRGLIREGIRNRPVVSEAPAPLPRNLIDYPAASYTSDQLILANFGINSWNFTREHIRQLEEFINLLNSSVTYEVLEIVGRASDTGPEDESEIRPGRNGPGNIELSRLRASNVSQHLNDQDLFSVFVPTVQGLGSDSPLSLANGEVGINRSVLISFRYVESLPRGRLNIPQSIRTVNWAVSINSTISGGEGGGLLYARGTLKNRDTGNEYPMSIFEAGFTGGSPVGASGSQPNYKNFTTTRPVDILAFHNRSSRLSSITAAGAVGGSYVVLHLPFVEKELNIVGVAHGLDASAFLGVSGRLKLSEQGGSHSALARARLERRAYNERVRQFNRLRREGFEINNR